MRSVSPLVKLIGAAALALILSAGIIGTSYAYFSTANSINTRAVMGDLDVVFSDIHIEGDDAQTTEARIVNCGKSISLNVGDAVPGNTSVIEFEVTNKGSVPVRFELKQPYTGEENPVRMDVSVNSDYIRGDGGRARGRIVLTVGDGGGEGVASLYTELNFQQAVVEIG